MLGIDAYGSDDDDDDDENNTQPVPISKHTTTPAAHAPKPPTSKTTVSLPQVKKRSAKVAFELPKIAKTEEADESDVIPAAKRPRSQGAGKSSLLGMLPPPKATAKSSDDSQLERVLGGGSSSGLQFKHTDAGPSEALGFTPRTTGNKKQQQSSNSQAKDFFSLGGIETKSSLTTNAAASSLSISSAPSIPTFEPPEPTTEDEYPGYYKLPSGKWAQYDQEYYNTFWKQKQDEWQKAFVATEKGFENAQDNAEDVSAADQMDHGRQLREEQKALTKNAGTGLQKPNMNIAPPKIGSRARVRHQLSALLTEAYDKREELEEKIAQARRNRKEAGNKYGF